MKLNKTIVILTSFIISVFIIGGCGRQPEAILDKILKVSDFQFTKGGDQAVIMNFGGDNDNLVSVTIHRSNVYKGFSINSERRSGTKKISIDCIWAGKKYIESSKYDTFTHFNIDNIIPSKKIAEVFLEGRLVNINTLSDFIIIPKSTITITGNSFENLTKKFK